MFVCVSVCVYVMEIAALGDRFLIQLCARTLSETSSVLANSIRQFAVRSHVDKWGLCVFL